MESSALHKQSLSERRDANPGKRAVFFARNGRLIMNRAIFFEGFRHNLAKSLTGQQVQGTTAILDAWDKDGDKDPRKLAYALATSWHETATRMWPIKEFGLGHGHPYGKPGRDGQAAYGRGFVQLTWATNYEKFDHALSLGNKLVEDYDLALEPDIAARILIVGMMDVGFTAFKLAHYFNDDACDWLHARRIINGMDCAEKVAGYARTFYHAIGAAHS
jgi:putative chitinase